MSFNAFLRDPVLRPEAYPCLTIPVCPMKRHHPDVHFIVRLPVDVDRIRYSAPSYKCLSGKHLRLTSEIKPVGFIYLIDIQRND